VVEVGDPWRRGNPASQSWRRLIHPSFFVPGVVSLALGPVPAEASRANIFPSDLPSPFFPSSRAPSWPVANCCLPRRRPGLTRCQRNDGRPWGTTAAAGAASAVAASPRRVACCPSTCVGWRPSSGLQGVHPGTASLFFLVALSPEASANLILCSEQVCKHENCGPGKVPTPIRTRPTTCPRPLEEPLS